MLAKSFATLSSDVAPSFYRATIGVWSSVMPCWAVVAAVRGAKPSVERSAADPVLAEQIGCLHASLVFLQDRNDLPFRVPLALHRLVLSSGPDSNPSWINSRGQRHQTSLYCPNVNVKFLSALKGMTADWNGSIYFLKA